MGEHSHARSTDAAGGTDAATSTRDQKRTRPGCGNRDTHDVVRVHQLPVEPYSSPPISDNGMRHGVDLSDAAARATL